MAVQNAANGVVTGHSKSWAMPPFDRAHTTSYSTLTETMCVSFTVFEYIGPIYTTGLDDTLQLSPVTLFVLHSCSK